MFFQGRIQENNARNNATNLQINVLNLNTFFYIVYMEVKKREMYNHKK
jgi:hypothetical protein